MVEEAQSSADATAQAVKHRPRHRHQPSDPSWHLQPQTTAP